MAISGYRRRSRGCAVVCLGLVWAVATSGLPATARAQSGEGAAPASLLRSQPNFRRFQLWEYPATIGMALGALGIVLFAPAPTDGATGGLLYDEAARSLLRSSSRGGRDLARTVGDFGYRFMLAFPILDAIVTAGLIHGDFDAAFQIAAIDAEVIAFAGFVSLLLEHVLARARPSTAPCASDPDYEAFCSSADVHNSFPSGHTMIAAAGAGLTCVHHLKLPLYGGGAGDLAACAGAVAIALSVAVARIVNDRHWTTDVTVGLLLGGVAGYVWPALYHYRARAEKTTATWYWLPVATPDGVGGHVYGRF